MYCNCFRQICSWLFGQCHVGIHPKVLEEHLNILIAMSAWKLTSLLQNSCEFVIVLRFTLGLNLVKNHFGWLN